LQAVTSKTFVVSLLCEFIGTMIFTFLGSTVSDKVGVWATAADVYTRPRSALY
jgi:glycerol uptake facilitator-like aquaporin